MPDPQQWYTVSLGSGSWIMMSKKFTVPDCGGRRGQAAALLRGPRPGQQSLEHVMQQGFPVLLNL